MLKSDIKFYSSVLINADLDFLKFQITKRGVKLIPNTGLQKLIEDCEAYISLPADTEIYNSTIKPLLVLYSLSDTLRILWLKKKEFDVQLRAMNSGTYEYGVLTLGDNNFKDFELEIFSAAYLNQFGVNVDLPQHTAGNDILYNEIEIQCKHPEVFTREKIDRFLRDFQSSLQTNNKYGVLGLGLDDYLAFTDNSFPIDFEAFDRAYRMTLLNQDRVLQEVMDDTLRYCPRVLGVYLVNTHFSYNTEMGLSLMKTTNSVFCLRPSARPIVEETQRQAYEILTVFNEKPTFRSY
jgi:hypothetical protein